MSKKLKLTTISLETKDGKKVELSLDEAKELHDQLHELFGEKYIPTAPIVIERDRWPWRYPYSPVWYGTGTNTNDLQLHQGGLDVQCKLEGNTGLSVTYSGSAL